MKISHIGLSRNVVEHLAARASHVEEIPLSALVDADDLAFYLQETHAAALVMCAEKGSWILPRLSEARRKGLRIAVVSIARPELCATQEESFRLWAEREAAFRSQGGTMLLSSPAEPHEVWLALQSALSLTRPQSFGVQEFVHRDVHLRLNPEQCLCEVDGVSIQYTKSEWLILASIVRACGEFRSIEKLIAELYPWGNEPEHKIVPVFMVKIRKKMREAHPELRDVIETVYRFGYRFRAQRVVSERPAEIVEFRRSA